jgi:hypothetical protein
MDVDGRDKPGHGEKSDRSRRYINPTKSASRKMAAIGCIMTLRSARFRQ